MIAVWSEDETAICQEVEWRKEATVGRKSFFKGEVGAWERKSSAVQDVALDCPESADDRRDGGRKKD